MPFIFDSIMDMYTCYMVLLICCHSFSSLLTFDLICLLPASFSCVHLPFAHLSLPAYIQVPDAGQVTGVLHISSRSYGSVSAEGRS